MNQLHNLDEFQKLATDYHVSAGAKQALSSAQLVLCSAASATGRNTIIRELVKTGKYYFVVSDTTRKPRINDGVLEKDGVEYWFRTEDAMLEDIKAGKLVEFEIIHRQQVSGMSVREVEKATSNGKIAITDADRGGVASVIKEKPDTLCLFFLPPSFDSWQTRLRGRGNMDPKEYKRRMDTAIQEYENALAQSYYTFVINDILEKTVQDVDAIVHGHFDEAKQQEARHLAESILAQLKTDLNS